jgi:hypothetical protein
MKARAFAFVLLALAATAAAQNAAAKTGNTLYQECSAPLSTQEGLVSRISCAAYIDGVADTEMALSVPLKEAKATKGICRPAGVTLEQMIDVVAQFLTSRPSRRAEPASQLVLVALFNAWPCE